MLAPEPAICPAREPAGPVPPFCAFAAAQVWRALLAFGALRASLHGLCAALNDALTLLLPYFIALGLRDSLAA